MVNQLRKTRMGKRFNYSRNRKRMRNKLETKGTIKEQIIKKEWQQGKSLTKNLNEMGLAFDVNKTFKVPNNREQRKRVIKLVNGFYEEDNDEEVQQRPKNHVAETLERESKEFVESRFRLPKGVAKQAMAYIDKYGLDYKAMARDPTNYYQETWRQIRAKVRKFLSIPEQCTEYLAERGWLDEEISEDDPRWQEAETDDD